MQSTTAVQRPAFVESAEAAHFALALARRMLAAQRECYIAIISRRGAQAHSEAFPFAFTHIAAWLEGAEEDPGSFIDARGPSMTALDLCARAGLCSQGDVVAVKLCWDADDFERKLVGAGERKVLPSASAELSARIETFIAEQPDLLHVLQRQSVEPGTGAPVSALG